jgi:hypothetical protein
MPTGIIRGTGSPPGSRSAPTAWIPPPLLAGLKAGAYYSTQDPRIDDVTVDTERVRVDRSPARAVALTGIHGWRSDVAIGDGLEGATLDLGRLRSPYWRLTITDADGRRAWTNPVWV